MEKKIQGSENEDRDQKKKRRIRSGLWALFEWRENKENLGWDMKESKKE